MDSIILWTSLGTAALVLITVAVIVVIKLNSRRKTEDKRNYWYYQDRWLVNAFDNFDVGVYGLRGAGKDVLFCHAINIKGGKHYSNIRYNDLTEVRDLKDLHVGGNEYPDFIEGNLRKFASNFEDGYHFFVRPDRVLLTVD